MADEVAEKRHRKYEREGEREGSPKRGGGLYLSRVR